MKLVYERNKGRLCFNCGTAPAYAKRRCEPCYRWWLSRGYERPEDLHTRHGERLELEARSG
jgi:hypothetical protein